MSLLLSMSAGFSMALASLVLSDVNYSHSMSVISWMASSAIVDVNSLV